MSTQTSSAIQAAGPGEGRTVRFYRDEYEIKRRGEDADVLVLTAAPGCEPPMHIHEREDEEFYVLDGRIDLFTPDGTIEAHPGTFVHLPRGVAHTFAVRSERARVLVTTRPGGFSGVFDAVAEAFDGQMPTDPSPEHGPVLGAVLSEFGVSIVGPNPAAG